MNSIPKPIKFKAGFTLVEMLVAISIIGMIAAVSTVSITKYRNRSYFDDAVTQVYGEVLKAQSLALAPGDTDVVSYTFSLDPATRKYEITVQKSDVFPDDILDSGKITNDVEIIFPPSIIFNAADGSSPGEAKTITITDKNSENNVPPKYIDINPAGTVELR